MKKIISLLLALTLLCGAVFTLASCKKDDGGDDNSTNNSSNTGGTVPDGPAKVLTVATSPDFPPFEYIENGEVVGIEVEIMQLICAELGYTLKIEQIDFDSVIPGIKSGKYMCGMSGISVTEDRKNNVLFTTPYCLAAQCIVVKADSTIEGKADLAGKTIAVQTGTTAEEFCLENDYTIEGYAQNADAKTALTTGRVDAWVVDDLTAAEFCKNDPAVKILSESMTTEPYAFAFNFKDEVLVMKFDEAIEKLMDEGKIAEIFEKYGALYTAPTED